ncbi:hypothetical protein ACTHAM_000325 [Cellulomonas soli]|uniref:hypothetical protein n=1 Tax=Cellulomonas soli TaxID=931535 RepID=UPI003F852FBB
MSRSVAAVTVVLACAVAAVGLVGATAAPARAAARVTVTNEAGTAQADTRWSTPLTVSGTGFQSIDGGFGGIYVLFGWVDDQGGVWRPSQGGVTGEDLRYVPDSEQAQNQGYQRFVSFPGSQTEGSANGGVIAADGSWSVTLTVPGPQFQALDRSGAATTVDCLQVTCGVITIGAHGVVNAANETFTPVSFGEVLGAAAVDGSGGAGAAAADGAAADGAEAVQAPALATLGISPSAPVVGRVISFTGQGFTPGEQVVGSLGAGLAAVGPLTAGAQGEVAGVLQLPPDLRPGTQVIRLTGAASGALAELQFEAVADPVAAAAALGAPQATTGLDPALVAVALAGLLLLATTVSSASTALRRRRARAARTLDPQGAR